MGFGAFPQRPASLVRVPPLGQIPAGPGSDPSAPSLGRSTFYSIRHLKSRDGTHVGHCRPCLSSQPAPRLSGLRVVPLPCRVGTCAVPRTPPRASAGRATHNAARIGMTCRAARTAACVGRTCRRQSWAQNAVGVLAKAAPSPHLVAPGEGSAHVHVAVVWLFCRLEKCRTKIIQN